ncbi:MAG: hypothetical protein EOS25_28190 [Mesorhizobium sp.]|uniref:hypothetical protein n=1 Tax=Mesorhizobium sp. TaxID=1871066 RepID=UPI000FE67AED|nr:hypothetical protein [Mesorhizobium sp.]RWE63022.1 MAG: hypothetical protein EOS24_05250 [Mesorhizobium sp.]RWF09808.1 MAG: hypothetical protein EOS69_17905 [Mesorhizobium sp.]RWF14165.1 MAG: hypothetical protein EOS25_28190 [Mesorhizobium sp.]TIY05986.1 MAG: hypothetical protein E5V22_05185 [Mesorhizobium sp.]
MTSGRSDLIDLTLALHAATSKAVRVSETGDDSKAVWVPLSECEMVKKPGGLVVVTMPEWLALSKGFI